MARRDVAFGRRLVDTMKEARRFPTELARELHVHPTTMARWRSGGVPDPVALRALANALRVRVEWLKTGQGPRSAPEAPQSGGGRARRRYGEILQEIGELAATGQLVEPEQVVRYVMEIWGAAAREAPELVSRPSPSAGVSAAGDPGDPPPAGPGFSESEVKAARRKAMEAERVRREQSAALEQAEQKRPG